MKFIQKIFISFKESKLKSDLAANKHFNYLDKKKDGFYLNSTRDYIKEASLKVETINKVFDFAYVGL